MTGLAFLGPALAPAPPAGPAPLGGAWFRLVERAATLDLAGDLGDADRVRALLHLLDDAPPPGTLTVALIGYEAGVALDGRAPRRARDPALGPDLAVWRARPTTAPTREPPHRLRLAVGERAHTHHLARVQAAKELLLDGVIYQANLAHRMAVAPATRAQALGLFQAALEGGLPPCAAWLDLDGFGSVVSLSPERFVTVDPATTTARAYPIKGTRPRGATPDEDRARLAELCASEKDAAEHVMIVDLLRNDLGRLAVAGGVTVERLLDVVSVKNVHHLESTVAALLGDGLRNSDVLAATLPGGSITGAPKSSAIESIAALEDGPRGLYTGALAVVDEHGALRSSLLIRTWLRPDEGQGALHVGGGIVVDSEPEAEWAETIAKARAFGDVSPC
ncbi:MAG: anthranilate synthase component I family protein [Deltaproteobacteria bacterium]|nr:anthranilate synthase component I family protein [Deltaproteobacteria bacterium]